MTKHTKGAAFASALPLQTRLLADASSYVDETREMDVVASTGATVRRARYEGWDRVPYDEELLVSEQSVNMARMNASAPVLDSHSSWGGIRNQLGVVVRAWVEDGNLMARIRLHAPGVSEVADQLAGMIRGGTAPKISLGYILEDVDVIEPQKRGEVERWLVKRWQPYEISFVSVPADAGTGVRSADDVFAVTFNRALPPNSEEKTMDKDSVEKTSPGAEPVDNRAAADAAVRAALTDERQRVSAIRQLGATHKLPDALVAAALEHGTSIAAFRAQVLDHLASQQEKQPVVTATGHPSGDDPAVRRAAMTEALVARILRKDPATDHARQYMDAGFAEMAADILGETRSRRLLASQRESLLHRAFHTTSDFPGLLENSANKVLLTRYQAASPTYRAVGLQRNFTDFKAHAMLRPGDFPTLLQVGEHGEIKAGTVSESKETMVLATFGRQVRFTRNVLINDDLNAIADILGSIGQRVADFENALFWAKVVENPVLATDSTAVFDATDHGNYVSSGSAIDVTTLGAGRAAMMKQTSLDGIKLNIQPRFLVTGPDRITKAEQITTPIVPSASSDANVFGPRLTPIADANISGNAWYLFADPSTAATFVYGYLEGAAGPQIRTEEPFGIAGIGLQVMLDFAVGAIDYRGAYLNAGA
ncbi:MAG: prohead protease/major capsid protein fusion protein [Armatimonadia bacterium]